MEADVSRVRGAPVLLDSALALFVRGDFGDRGDGLVVLARGLVPWSVHQVVHASVPFELGGDAALALARPVGLIHLRHVPVELVLVACADLVEVVVCRVSVR